MSQIEVNSYSAICSKCGHSYGRRKGYFAVSYAPQYKGIGYLTVCKECVDRMYNEYLNECRDPKVAVRQVCRSLNLYWSDPVFDMVDKKSTTKTMMTAYLAKLSTITYSGKSYDDTLIDEGTLWSSCVKSSLSNGDALYKDDKPISADVEQSVVDFWGPGYTPNMYMELEQRRKFWMGKLGANEDADLDAGTEAIIRQICNLEIDINRDRAAGKSIKDSVNALNSLLGSASLKPAQKKQDDIDASLRDTPLGVWLYKYENKRPLPEIDESLKDVKHIKKYIFTWMGHLCKMLGVKNGYSDLYEDEIERLRVEKPKYKGDDEALMYDYFMSTEEDDVE